MAKVSFQTKLAIKRLATNIANGLPADELTAMLNEVLAGGYVWGMAHDLASVKALISVSGGEMAIGQRRMAALLVNEELDRLSCDKGWKRACVGTPLTEYRARAFRAGKFRVFVQDSGAYCVVRSETGSDA